MLLYYPFNIYYLLSTVCVPGSVLGVAETKYGKDKSIYFLCVDRSFYIAAATPSACFSSFFLFVFCSCSPSDLVQGQMTSEGNI